MRVCLASATTIPDIGERAHVGQLRVQSEEVPLGILSLAAVLERLGIPPIVVPMNHLYYDFISKSIESKALDFCNFAAGLLAATRADVFGLSTICASYPLTIRMAAALRNLSPGCTIVLGGPQAAVVDEQTLLAFPSVDFVLRGEAEETLPQLLQHLSGTRSAGQVPGLTYRIAGKVVRNPDAPVIPDLDALPDPAFHLYFNQTLPSDYISLELGRGCPFACNFCSTNDFFRRRFRLKSPGRVLQQMIALNEAYGVKRFELVHDMFTVDRKRVMEFCDTLLASGRNFNWSCSARTDFVDESLLERMARAGCSGIFFGIESGSPRIQEFIGKRLDLQEAAHVLELTHKYGMKTTASLITGFPQETRKDLEQTTDWMVNALRYENVDTQLHLLAPLSKTPLQIEYRHRLTLRAAPSDMPTEKGWERDVAGQDLVRQWPDIFANFYTLPTLIDPVYLEEFRAFLLAGTRSIRWLLVALHAHAESLLFAFDRWRAWLDENKKPVIREKLAEYYFSPAFVDDLFTFVGSTYTTSTDGHSVVTKVLAYEMKWRKVWRELEAQLASHAAEPEPMVTEVTLRTRPIVARGTRLVEIDPDVVQILQAFKPRQRAMHHDLPSSPQFLCLQASGADAIELRELPSLACTLLSMCDGDSSLEDICTRYSALDRQELKQLTPLQICVSGLVKLAEQGLVHFVN